MADSWQTLERKSSRENDIASVQNALWEEQGRIVLVLDRNFESRGMARDPRRRPVIPAVLFLLIGLLLCVLTFSKPTTVTTKTFDKTTTETLPFNPIAALAGLMFCGIGYYLFNAVNQMTMEPNGAWSVVRGVRPFVKQYSGSREEIDRMEVFRHLYKDSRGRESEVWRGRLLLKRGDIRKLDLSSLDMQTNAVDRATVTDLYSAIASRLGVAFSGEEITETISTADNPEAEEDPLEPPVWALPARYSGSRWQTEADGAGTMILTVQPVSSFAGMRLITGAVIALFTVVPLLIMAKSIDDSHRQFLESVPPASRAFFESHGSPLGPFIVFVIVVGTCVVGLSIWAYLWRQRITPVRFLFEPDQILLENRAGAELGRYPLASITSVRIDSTNKERAGASMTTSMGVGYVSKPTGPVVSLLGALIPVGSRSSGERLVLSGPHQADIDLGGADLSPTDFAWFTAVVRGLIDPEMREATIEQALAPAVAAVAPKPSDVSVEKRTTHTLGYIAAGVTLISLINSYTINLAYKEEWTGSDGTRFRHWTSGWKEAWYSQEAHRSSLPVPRFALREENRFLSGGSSIGLKKDIAPEVPPRGNYHWNLEPVSFVRLNVPSNKEELTPEDRLMLSMVPGEGRAGALNRIADRRQEQGKYPQAEALFEEADRAAVTLEDHGYARESLAYCYMAQENLPAALQALRSVLAISGSKAEKIKEIKSLIAKLQTGKGTVHQRVFGPNVRGRFPGEGVASSTQRHSAG